MTRILVLNGPNLNLLGDRDPSIYGSKTLDEINNELFKRSLELEIEIVCYQSNHEGSLIDKIHDERRLMHGLIINPGALAHYSYALRDALEAAGVPVVEVHISNIFEREEWRRHSVTSPVAWKTIAGEGTHGYSIALDQLVSHLGGISTNDDSDSR